MKGLSQLKTKATKYLTKEYKLLKEYRTQYKQFDSLVKMREDKIKGAEDIVISLGIMSLNEVYGLKNKVLNGGG